MWMLCTTEIKVRTLYGRVGSGSLKTIIPPTLPFPTLPKRSQIPQEENILENYVVKCTKFFPNHFKDVFFVQHYFDCAFIFVS